MDICEDNVFEWYTGSDVATVTFSQRKYINKINKYAKEFSDDIEIVAENEDGSVCAHVPVCWFKFSPPRKGKKLTDEEKAIVADRLRKARKRNNVDNVKQ